MGDPKKRMLKFYLHFFLPLKYSVAATLLTNEPILRNISISHSRVIVAHSLLLFPSISITDPSNLEIQVPVYPIKINNLQHIVSTDILSFVILITFIIDFFFRFNMFHL